MRIFVLFTFIFSFDVTFSQDFYFYRGSKINLEQRTDKAAIILNSNFLTKDNKEKNVSGLINSEHELIQVGDNYYLINFKETKSESEVRDLMANLSSLNNLIKFGTPVYFGESQKVTQIPTDEFIVRLNDINNKEYLEILNLQHNISIVGNVSDEKGFLLKSNDNVRHNALALSQIYFNTGLFQFAEPNFVYPEECLLAYTPNDPYYDKQWPLNNTGQTVPSGLTRYGDVPEITGIPGADMDVNLAWDFTTGNPSIKIGILDTGIDSTHPDFASAGHLLTGYDAYYDKYGVPDDSTIYGGHGTCAAGLVGALMNNSVGVAGVAPDCKVMAFRIFNLVLHSTSVIVIGRAFDTARVQGIDVLSNSWNGMTATTTLSTAIDNAALSGRYGAGCFILFSSGNDGRNSVWYPSYMPNAMSVGASTPLDQKKAPGTGNQFDWGGNYGEDANGDLDLVAPAICYTTDIQGTMGYHSAPSPSGDYFGRFSGTSSSCPNTAGVVALILSVNPALSKLDVLDKLYRGCDKIENIEYSINKVSGKWSQFCGYGRVNAYSSVRLTAGVDVTPPTINHKSVVSHSSTFPTIISAEIIDQDGSPVPATGTDQPVLFFRTNKMNAGWSAFDSIIALNDGNSFTFNVPCQGYETQVEYYIRARDISGNECYFPSGAPDEFWLSYFAVGDLIDESRKVESFTCDSVVTLSPSVTFPNFTIADSRVQIYLNHPNVREEIIQLYSPLTDANNNRKCLFASNGGSGSNIHGAFISDHAANLWMAGNPPYTNGSFKAEYLLNGLNGTNAAGNWKILNYDPYPNNNGVFDSILILLTRTSGTVSSSLRFNSAEDSILYFGSINYPDSLMKDFYFKNAGTSDLIVDEVNFSGTYAYEFTLESFEADPILPGDSGRVSVIVTPTLHSQSATLVDAVMTLSTNDPSKLQFEVSLQYHDRPLPVELASFSSSVSGRNVTLNWSTAMEENNSGFEIERSDTENENPNYEKVGFVTGNGNSNSIINYSFKDNNLNSGKYNYRLKQIDYNGNFEYHNLGETVSVGIPQKYAMSQNYPNPFNPVTKIDYDLPHEGFVTIKIFDMTGKELNSIVSEFKTAGYHTAEFHGENLSSGVYFYNISIQSAKPGTANSLFSEIKKMILIK